MLILPNSCIYHDFKAPGVQRWASTTYLTSLRNKKYGQFGLHFTNQITGLRKQEINHRSLFKWIIYLYLLVNCHKFPIILDFQVIRQMHLFCFLFGKEWVNEAIIQWSNDWPIPKVKTKLVYVSDHLDYITLNKCHSTPNYHHKLSQPFPRFRH